MKVAVALASNDMVYTDCAMSLMSMVTYTRDVAANVLPFVINKKSAITDRNRCDLVNIAKENGADKILLIDPDMTFPPHTLLSLIKTGKDIISTYCTQRQPPYNTTALHLDLTTRLNPSNTGGIVKVKWIGTPTMLIDMTVFEKIGMPYFKAEYYPATDQWEGCDLWFCRRAQEKGYDVWCHAELSKEIGHLGTHPFKLSDFFT